MRMKKIDNKRTADIIESNVYERMKTEGFKRYGRTLHRFVEEDISQIIHFQLGRDELAGRMCVNIGIRIPECEERAFNSEQDKRAKYYHEYECTMRSRLGEIKGKKETWYLLRGNTERVSKKILKEIINEVIPVFNILNCRHSILEHRREYPLFDTMSRHLILLHECMIYGHIGDIVQAKKKFDDYYHIYCKENGYVTVYGADDNHIRYLDELYTSLGFTSEKD